MADVGQRTHPTLTDGGAVVTLVLAGLFNIAFTSAQTLVQVPAPAQVRGRDVIAIALLAIEHAIIGRPSATERGGRA